MKKLLVYTIASLLICTVCFAKTPAPEFNLKKAAKRIDQLVEAGLKKHKQERQAKVSDSIFVRRVYLDIIGRIPTIEESEAFLVQKDKTKRQALIANLLQSSGHVSHSYNFWADVLRVNKSLGNANAQAESAYQLWIKDAVESNMPYDEMVYELVSATGKIWDNGAVGYYLRDRGMPLDNMSNTVRVFLGTRLECAQCHNHPFDKWTQMDYFKMAAFSYGMDANRGYSSENRMAYNGHRGVYRKEAHDAMLVKAGFGGSRFPVISNERSLEKMRESKNYPRYLKKMQIDDAKFDELAKLSIEAQEPITEQGKAGDFALSRIYQQMRYFSADEKSKSLKLPHDYQYDDAKPHDVVEAATMFGDDIDFSNIDDGAIQSYAKWMTAKNNPTFTKVIANRLWKRVFGHGVFEPVDELTDHTYVANPELLTYLEKVMRSLNYDMRKYQEVLFNTRTYQSESYNGEMIMGAPYHFTGPVFRRMSAEQIWDSIVALALPEADNYRPRLKSQLGMIEKFRQNYVALEEQSPEDYIAMVDELSEAIKDNGPMQAEMRKKMYDAREAKDEQLYSKLKQELNEMTSKERKVIRDIAFDYTGKEIDADALLASAGMMDMNSMSDMEGQSEQVVMTQLPKIKVERKPPEGLTKSEIKRWKYQQSSDLRYYKTLVGQMARASELESPARRGHFLREFGQSDREVIENSASHASVPQALNLLNGPIVEALINKYAVFGSRIHGAGTPEEKTKMIFRAMLTREPTEDEIEIVEAEISRSGDKAYEGIVWALLNTQQFIFVQ